MSSDHLSQKPNVSMNGVFGFILCFVCVTAALMIRAALCITSEGIPMVAGCGIALFVWLALGSIAVGTRSPDVPLEVIDRQWRASLVGVLICIALCVVIWIAGIL